MRSTPSRTRRPVARTSAAIGAALALALLAPAPALAAPAAPAAPAAAAPAADACTVTQATLTWGFKESFRSYISGTIAHGQWETIDGASYATPVFSWTSATGELAPDGGRGAVAFTGGIRFTGHDGLLDTTVANPTLELTADGARLLIDVSGVSMENAMAGSDTVDTVTQIPFVTVDLSAATIVPGGDTMTLTADAAATAITAEGFAAFGNYETGTAFDPISLSVTAACPVAAEETPAPTATAVPISAEVRTDADDDAQTGWGVLAGVGAGVAVIAAAGAAIVVARRRRAAATAPADPPGSSGGDGS